MNPSMFPATTGGMQQPRSVRLQGLGTASVEALSTMLPVAEDGMPIQRQKVQARPTHQLPRLHPSGSPVDESYLIVVREDGVELHAATDEGELRAATTLAMLLTRSRVPLGAFSDAPRLGWRGLTLDVARTPFPLAALREVVEIIASLHGNVLHLHLTDDQGWRLPIPSRPRLAEVGGKMAMGGLRGFAYDLDEYIDFVRWAEERHVWIVPEVDVPGHVGALVASYPEIAAGEGTPGEYASRLHLDIHADATFTLLAEVLETVAAAHRTPYLHLGGDEAFGMADAAYRAFFARLVRQLDLDPTRLIGWQEAVRADVGFQTLQVWRDLDREGLETDPEVRRQLGLLAAADLGELTARGRADVARISREQRDVVLSPALVAYLDRPYADVDVDGEVPDAGLAVYRPRTVRQSFEFTLEHVVPGLDPSCVAGVEAALWTETIPDAYTAQKMLLPRLAGVLQRAWEQEPLTWSQHAEHLRRLQPVWDARGWHHHRSIQVAQDED